MLFVAALTAVSVVTGLFAIEQIEALRLAAAAGEASKSDAIYRYALHWVLIQLAMALAIGLAAYLFATQHVRTRARELAAQAQCLREGKSIESSRSDEFALVTEVLEKLGHELEAMSTQVRLLSQASRNGNLGLRGDVEHLSGPLRGVVRDLNEILDQALGPVNAQALALQQMAQGDLTVRIGQDYVGDHARISAAINQVADIATRAMAEFQSLIKAFDAGEYGRRAPAAQFNGSWHSVMAGVNSVLDVLHRTSQSAQSQNWIKTGLADLGGQIRGDLELDELARQTVGFLARYTDAQVGALYAFDAQQQKLHLAGSYALELRQNTPRQFALGESLVGQVALDKKLVSVTQLPRDYARVASGTGAAMPQHAVVLPLLYEGQLKGVVELARLREFDAMALELLQRAADVLGMALHAAEAATRTRRLLQETQEQALQLQMQQEELQQQNEELEEQTQALKASEEKLKTQQEELQQTNEELEEHTQMLNQHSSQIALKNSELEKAQADILRRADELALASKYKSEFLANMSHELRTPLNSMLLLARSLSDNRDGNLSDKQVLSAKTMYQSGNDLLAIINDILDLSKIEAGREQVVLGSVELQDLLDQTAALFAHAAEEKNLALRVTLDKEVPQVIHSDRQRLGQILRNLLSNAFKFTHQGGVTLTIAPCPVSVQFRRNDLVSTTAIAFTVQDTGIGIAPDRQQQIWEAFQQADGSSSRQYGGTGLGLTISRELARLLGGEIHLQSEPGTGSTFTLYLPLGGPALAPSAEPASESKASMAGSPPRSVQRIADDRADISRTEGVIMIVEDDPQFAQLLSDLCHEQGMKVLTSPTAEEAIALLNDYAVRGVMLDMQLPVRDGWAVLSHIKRELDTMHIPVYVISAEERNRQTLQHGAIGFLRKPVSPEQLQAAYATVTAAQGGGVKTILLVEDDATLRGAVRDLLRADDVVIHEVGDGASALAVLETTALDLIILDLGLPDMSGFELLDRMRARAAETQPPVIVSTGRDLTREEYDRLQRYAVNVIIKGVRSDERLVEEVTLFLHRRVASLPDRARKMLLSLHDRDALFTGKQILLVDDDIRNVYSLSGVLEERGITVLTARNGQEALDVLDKHPNIDLLLTDIMMPVMDGYELIRKVRKLEPFARLPILALTAKAMQDDRQRCLDAGASDYLSKPVELDRLLSLLRVWMYR